MSNREYPDHPLVAVSAVVVNDGKVALVQRGNEPARGKWSVPGGLMETGERIREAAAREVREETGLDVEVGEVLAVVDSIARDPDGRVKYQFVLVDFLATWKGGNLRRGSDTLDARWVAWEDLDGYDLTDGLRGILESVRRRVIQDPGDPSSDRGRREAT